MCAELDRGNFGNPEDPIDIFRGDYKQRQVECAVELYGHMGIEREDKAGRLYGLRRNFEFFDAPHIAIICMESSFGIGVALDVGMYVQTRCWQRPGHQLRTGQYVTIRYRTPRVGYSR